MYRLGSIARRLVRDDAELGYEFGDDMSGLWMQGFGVKYIQRRYFEVGHRASDYYVLYVLSRSCVQPRHWELEHSASDYYEIYVSAASAFNQAIGDWNTENSDDYECYV